MLKTMLVGGAAAATLALGGAAEAAPVSAQIAPAVVSKDVYLKHDAPFPGGVTGHPDLTYSTVAGYRPMTLDLYAPSRSKAARPLAIYVHGGGWTGGTARNASRACSRASLRGAMSWPRSTTA